MQSNYSLQLVRCGECSEDVCEVLQEVLKRGLKARLKQVRKRKSSIYVKYKSGGVAWV